MNGEVTFSVGRTFVVVSGTELRTNADRHEKVFVIEDVS